MEMRTPKRHGESDAGTSAMIQDAAAWDSRLRAPDCTDDDRVRFAAWRDADPARSLVFERLQVISASLRRDRGRADVRALRDEALRTVGAKRRRRLAWAAAAACVLALGAALWRMSAGEWALAPLNDLVARFSGTESYATGIGQRSTFVLEDGSSVELNAQSKINVAFTKSQRNVELVQGQALFDVAKNPLRPFIVHAGDRRIIAVGTQFDVRLDTRSVQVTLIEGKVRVVEGEASAGSNEILLTPGKQLVAKLQNSRSRRARTEGEGGADDPARAAGSALRDGSAQPPEAEYSDIVRDVDVAKVTGWQSGRVFLEDLSLEDAVAEMNKYSSTQIRLGDPSLAGLRVNGMFMAGAQQAFVTALESYFPIVAERRGEKEIVLTPAAKVP